MVELFEGRVQIREIAKRHDCSERTVYRAIQKVSELWKEANSPGCNAKSIRLGLYPEAHVLFSSSEFMSRDT